jgi:hypothetical protein
MTETHGAIAVLFLAVIWLLWKHDGINNRLTELEKKSRDSIPHENRLSDKAQSAEPSNAAYPRLSVEEREASIKGLVDSLPYLQIDRKENTVDVD